MIAIRAASRLVCVSLLGQSFLWELWGTAGPWSCSQPPLHQGCPGLMAVGWVPGYFQGKGCCVKSTCHLSVKMFWILNDESLISPAVPSAARTSLPIGLYQGVCWKTLSWSFVLCKVHTPHETSYRRHWKPRRRVAFASPRDGEKTRPHSPILARGSFTGPAAAANFSQAGESRDGSTCSCQCSLAGVPMPITKCGTG